MFFNERAMCSLEKYHLKYQLLLNKVFIIFIFTSVVRMSEPTAKKVKLGNYRENFIMLGFVYVDSIHVS